MAMFKTCLFDFDGTLANTIKPILATLKGTLAKLDVPVPEEAALAPLIGLPLREIFSRAAHTNDSGVLNKAVQIYRNDFFEHCQNNLELYPGVRDTLNKLQKVGIILAISSSRGKESLLRLVDLLDIGQYFSIIAGEEDVLNPKPAPDLAHYILKKLAVPPESALVVGDTIFDIGMGKAANIKTCAVTYGNQDRGVLEEAKPDFMIDNFYELEKLF